MTYYADSSFLVSCYLADANTQAAQDWLNLNPIALPFTSFHDLEVGNAFEISVFRKLIDRAAAKRAAAQLRADLKGNRLVKTGLDWAAVMQTARALSKKFGASIGVRSLDIIHVAAAKSLNATEL